MENTSSSTLSDSSSLAYFLFFHLVNVVLTWVAAFKKFYSSSRCLIGISKCLPENTKYEILMPVASLGETVDYAVEKDVEMVMENLRIAYKCDQELVHCRLSSSDLSNLFEDLEPSLQEIKDAFDIFDENRDGFVDALELQRVLCCLGLKEGSKVQDCETMIRKFDENGDGKIEFNEFVKIMEKSFC